MIVVNVTKKPYSQKLCSIKFYFYQYCYSLPSKAKSIKHLSVLCIQHYMIEKNMYSNNSKAVKRGKC